MASTSAFFSAKMSTCPKRAALVRGFHPESPSIDPYHHLSSWELWDQPSPAVLTGGGVFCKHSSRYTILASSFTYSTSCHHRGQVR